MRGNAKSFSGDDKGALLDYNKVVELNPQQVNFYMNRADTKINLKIIEEQLLISLRQ